MKKLLFLLTIIFTVTSCTVNEKPSFVKVENIQIIEATPTNITISADAFFLNPNDLGGTLKSDGIDIIVNDINVGNVTSKSFDVPRKEEFTVPLTANIPTKKIFEGNEGGILGGILSSLLNKKMHVRYKGSITYTALGFSYDYLVDISKEVTIKF